MAKPAEVQVPAPAVEVEARDVEAATRTAQERAGQRDVKGVELGADQLALIGEHALAVGQPPVALELASARAHLRPADHRFPFLEEGAGNELADVKIECRIDIFHHRPPLGNEIRGVDEAGELSANCLESPLDHGLEREIKPLRIKAVALLLPHLPLDLVKLSIQPIVQVAFDDNGRHDNPPFLAHTRQHQCADKYSPVCHDRDTFPAFLRATPYSKGNEPKEG